MPSQKRADRMRNAATQEALRSTMRYRHGAIITKGGKILAQGHNHVRTGFSGPLSAHEAIMLPLEGGETEHDCCKTAQKGQSYFSMHAEMHAVTTALRGARPHMPRGGLLLDPVDEACTQLQSMALETPACSRFSDTSSTSAAKRSAQDIKSQFDRALVEGAKREQQRNELKRNRRHARVAAWDTVASSGGLWAGNQASKRRRSEQQAERARRLARRKEEKRARKARGARAASSGGSTSSTDSLPESDSASPPSDSSSDPPTPPSEPTDTPSLASATLAFRKVVRRAVPSMEDSRIRGADLYVVRLLQDTESKAKAKEQRRKHLQKRGATIVTTVPSPAPPAPAMPRYADSRPCWRCLEWMYWAGIKRVFWTDASGHWHGGKVSELLFGGTAAGGNVSYVPVHLTQYEHAAAMLRQRTVPL
ncbi:hypothetical protein MCAP1_000360 [Malassezia caprae]|uniref:CMP/dCMP-type deaminase domain-containing protein n=1 Tax=Malassezia caprae TaxID=1381934 RepID=A0AAF0E8N8_9BASI|nr:hypothetical protein MCAP1_000360 [Malassezia caprae]